MSESFTVNRHGSRYTFAVKVFDTKAKMYDYFRKRGKAIGLKRRDGELDFAAICMCYERIRTRDEKRMPDIGEVLFYRDRLGAGIVAHEMLHAAMHYERLVNQNTNATFTPNIGKEEERLAHTLTDLVRQFTETAYKRGLYA